jgi:hypothetical protein
MKTLFNKYWVQIIFLVAATLLFFILTPYVERSYLKTDVDAIREKTEFVLILTILTLLFIIIISTIKYLKTFKEFLNVILSIFSLGILLYFILNSIFVFGGFTLNKLFSNELVEKKYRVIYTNTDYILLQNLRSGKRDLIEQVTVENERFRIKQNDTIVLSFKKGWFGYEFDPKHRGDYILPANFR